MDRSATGLKFHNNEVISVSGNFIVYAESDKYLSSWEFHDNVYRVADGRRSDYRIGDRTFRVRDLNTPDRRRFSGFRLEKNSSFIIEDDPAQAAP
jgi:hypothetical protein